ncbi:hypothetical protein [Escherichia coli]|uniref:hypothetical protein n=1 Tax=Escherichia coli TaxID=562 RepID=UPI00293BDAFF|nr:hypothetical protein [Escherichia coli]
MIMLGVSILIGIIVGFIIDELCDNGIKGFLVMLGIVGTALVIFFGLFFTIDKNVEMVTKRDVTELVVLGDGQQTKGRMFLGSGYVDGELTYKYAYKKGEGYGIDMERADYVGESRYIKDGSKPRIEKNEVVYKSTWANVLVAPFFNTAKHIYVTEGTIQETFNIDLN